ncbi:L-threonylcarbamoyladenylate synthase [Deltaproteobacteria bacterium]|nr:L-threonylcarbamoyladenylate synthase [Deltaproteobacteria bacterium]
MEDLTGKPLVIRTEPDENLKTGLNIARQLLLSGGLVAFPTESFYGLAVNASDEDAVSHLFAIKKRESDRPVLVLIPSLDSLERYVEEIPEIALKVIKKFWPGGLTLLFRAGSDISRLLTAGTGKIGIRLSSHPVARALVKTVGSPITGTSANISGEPPCINAEDVLSSLGQKVDLVLDGGRTEGGKGSTILDVTVSPPEILREGMISHKQIRDIISPLDIQRNS